jgi:non-specific serine/threonine protein kinase
LFRQLAIFPEGFTLDAAEFLSASVASEADEVVPSDEGATLQELAQLVHRGLVRAPEAHRFRQLQTIRDYGLELLIAQGELEQCRRAHLAWCLSRTAEPMFDPLDGYIWATLEQADDLADLTAALAFAFEQGETEHALHLAVGLSPIWAELGRYDEARASLSRVVDDLPTASSRARAVITGWMAEWAWLQGDYAATTLLARTSLDSSRFLALSSGVAANLYRLGRVATLTHPPDGLPLLLDALALYRDLDDARGSFWSLLGLGHAALATGDVERAREWFAEAGDELVRVEESAGAWPTLGHALGLASLALATNDLFGAETMLVDALELSREHRNSYFECLALSLLCAVQRRNKTYVRAVESGRVGLQIAQRLGSPYRECQCLTQLARLALDAGKFDQAMLLQGASSQLREELGVAGADIGLSERLAHESAGRLERLALLEQAGRELAGSERLAQVMALELDLRQISEHTGALSVREREVLVLLSQGATNGTIADQLFVSRRTVETHVGSILRKLHVTTRVEAGRAARERGLLAAEEG